MGELIDYLKGSTSCNMQDTPLVCYDWRVLSGNIWSSEQNNNNNANYTNFPSGGQNAYSKNTSFIAVPFSEFNDISDALDLLLKAEEDCYRNKKSRIDACRFHFHLAEIIPLAKAIHDGTYKPDGGICFIITYPTIREVFCARYKDRIIHHLVAPYLLKVAEAVHTANGDVSHGNRKGHSAHTAALQIQEKMRQHPNGYVFKFDVKGFFMSIDRQMALETFRYYEDMHRPDGYTDEQRRFYLNLISTLILSDPTVGCELRSRTKLHESVPAGKSLFTSGGKGFPIGNFYSQILANVHLAPVDSELKSPHFVDDYSDAKDYLEEVVKARKSFVEELKKQGLGAHPQKMYIQPVRHGVAFCGRVIYKDRIYISNRVVKACVRKIGEYEQASLCSARAVMRSVNSYIGTMSHTYSYNIQKIIARIVLERFSEWIYFRNKKGHLICTIKEKYKEKNISLKQIKTLDNYVKRVQHRA